MRTFQSQAVRRTLSFILVFGAAFPASARTVDHSMWDSILQDSVEDGVVDYGKIQERYADLQGYLQTLETVPLDELDRNEKMALFINAYNAQCVRGVLDRGEIESVRNVFLFFKRTKFVLGGQDFSLDSLEHEALRPMGDPRIHFAIVCSSKSCPELVNEAYTSENLDAMLDRQARKFLADPEKNRLDREEKTLYLSKIFKWFEEDFTKDQPSILAYVSQYLDDSTAKFLEERKGEIRVEFLPYDWSLNGHY
ncbi:MAG: DUF547 domain-containing protein [Candidatus Omnitrophica bacterium]|nr:DUF547 domain-containing protein [Candidatus Omnitrophota bacterium]